MKNLVTLLVAGVMAVMLTACGEEPKKADMNAPAATQEETKAADANSAAPAEAAPAEAAPATTDAPADAAPAQ